LLVDGFNDQKHTTPYREETFGYPGARIDGKPTIGNVIDLALPPAVWRTLEGWESLDDAEREALRRRLQEAVGENRAFIEEATVLRRDDEARVEVKLRYPLDESDRDIEGVLAPAAEAWFRQRIASVVGRGGHVM
jgi:hypothetical protein